MLFEIHITGDISIHEKAKALGIKTIRVINLKPNGDILSIHHMTSDRRHFENYKLCRLWVESIEHDLGSIRTKIECPPYDEYMQEAIYAECHYKSFATKHTTPTSMNAAKTHKIATKRELKKYNFRTFCSFFSDQLFETELCLYDDNQDLDKEWMGLYGMPKVR